MTIATAPAPRDAAERLSRAILAVLSGQRPSPLLKDRCANEVLNGLEDFPMLRTPARLVSQWVCEPADDVAEVSTTFQVDGRTRAMAMRMEAHRGEWHVTAVHLA